MTVFQKTSGLSSDSTGGSSRLLPASAKRFVVPLHPTRKIRRDANVRFVRVDHNHPGTRLPAWTASALGMCCFTDRPTFRLRSVSRSVLNARTRSGKSIESYDRAASG